MRLGVEADGAHEAERLGDPVGEFLVALGLGAVLDEAQHPAMDVLEIGVAAVGEGAQKVERRRGLAIGFQLPARIGLARGGRELDVVDDVAAISRQRDAVDRLESDERGFANWPATRPTFTIGDAAAKVMTTAICRNTRKKSRILSAECSPKLSAQSPPCNRNESPAGRLAERLLEFARFACKNQRRIAGKLALGLGQRRTIGIDRRLRDRLRPPAIRGPTLIQHDPRHGESGRAPLLKVKRPIYSAALKANMPIFEIVHLRRDWLS